MKKTLLLIFILLHSFACTQNNEGKNGINYASNYGYFVDVYDHRKETQKFMKEQKLQGGGPTWMALLKAAFHLESPETLKSLSFDDEADAVRVKSKNKSNIIKVNKFVSKLKSDKQFMLKCISRARVGGYLE